MLRRYDHNTVMNRFIFGQGGKEGESGMLYAYHY
jgi:hypothetical protein